MSGYTEIFQVMMAMTLVSIMVLNANRLIQTNNIVLVEGHLEEQIVAYAQDIIEESRALSFDEQTTDVDSDGENDVPVYIPEGFSTLGTETGETSRDEFDDFDDFHNWSATVEINDITYNVSTIVEYVETSDYKTYSKTSSGTKSTLKRLIVNIQTKYLTEYTSREERVYSFDFVRSYYAD
ncbi:MAG: hypothetical protein JJ953_08365 [Gracilimonas sp.]|uniref:hypothetical protein n=1 Tax=Gracilimonas sp. TaxID=1974203 RepID=UPI001B2CD6ED|nr:hypothetical protein [Gracilimonas sp.]MBO6586101.1 hypothetical protein [Gracilimonas sp.]MBO6614758.1 hypothetical protein [Gracilimonas sp.]